MGCGNSKSVKEKKVEKKVTIQQPQETIQQENKPEETIQKEQQIEKKTIQQPEVITQKKTNQIPEQINQNEIKQTSENKILTINQNTKEESFETKLRLSALSRHNILRAAHGSPPLKLSDSLNEISQKYAEYLSKNEKFEHSSNKYNGEPLGENLFYAYGKIPTGEMVSDDWYSEIKDYNFSNPGFKSGTGHFTQVVWANSEEVGFGVSKSKKGNYYVVANYYPAGNYSGQFEENVKEIGSKSTNVKDKGNNNKKVNYLEDFRNIELRKHNEYRKLHGSCDLILNEELNQIAQNYANKIAKMNVMQHSDSKYKGKPLGENIYWCYGKLPSENDSMTKAWYDEIKDYNFKTPGFKNGTGHFTQVVWADSKEVGFGFAKTKDGAYMGVANYYPFGNLNTKEAFQKNVKPPQS